MNFESNLNVSGHMHCSKVSTLFKEPLHAYLEVGPKKREVSLPHCICSNSPLKYILLFLFLISASMYSELF